MKYIVYLTTNLKSQINGLNRIYIGVHKTKDPNKFDGYIGCGVKINAPSSYMFPKTPFQYAVKKYGVSSFKREILYVYDTMEEAYLKEKELVDMTFIKQSHVYNIALGGHGGEIVDPKIHCLPVYQFDLEGNLVNFWETTLDASDFYGCMVSKISKAINGYYECLGYFWARTDTITLSKYKTDHKKYTYLYNIDGKLINEFISRTECSKYLGCAPQSVSKAVIMQQPIKNHYVSDSIVDIFIPKPRITLKDKVFYLYTTTDYIGEFETKELLKYLQINTCKKLDSIINSNNGWYKDFYVSDSLLEIIPSKKHSNKSVDIYTKEGVFLETLDSVKLVKEKYNINNCQMSKILKGVKEHNNYIFKYNK